MVSPRWYRLRLAGLGEPEPERVSRAGANE